MSASSFQANIASKRMFQMMSALAKEVEVII